MEHEGQQAGPDSAGQEPVCSCASHERYLLPHTLPGSSLKSMLGKHSTTSSALFSFILDCFCYKAQAGLKFKILFPTSTS